MARLITPDDLGLYNGEKEEIARQKEIDTKLSELTIETIANELRRQAVIEKGPFVVRMNGDYSKNCLEIVVKHFTDNGWDIEYKAVKNPEGISFKISPPPSHEEFVRRMAGRMKRDMGLVRKILLAMETSREGWAPEKFNIPGHTEEEIGYNIYLMMQGGLVVGFDLTTAGDKCPNARAQNITWAGHEFLDLARKDTNWNKVIEAVKTNGLPMTIEVIMTALKNLAFNALGTIF